MQSVDFIAKALQKLARQRQLVKNSLVSDEHKAQLIAQIDQAERDLSAQFGATTVAAVKAQKG